MSTTNRIPPPPGDGIRIRDRTRFRATSPAADAAVAELGERQARDQEVSANPPADALDREISRSLQYGRPVDLERVHEELTEGNVVLRPEEQVVFAPNHPLGVAATVPPSNRPAGISERMAAVSTLPDNYAVWYRRLTVKRLMFRGIAPDKIAAQTNVSTRTIFRDIKTFNDEITKQLLDKPVEDYVAEQIVFYQEVRSMALRIATVETNTASARLGGLDTALRAQKAAEGLLETTGYLKSAPVIPKRRDKNGDASSADLMRNMLSQLMSGDDKLLEQMASSGDDDADVMALL